MLFQFAASRDTLAFSPGRMSFDFFNKEFVGLEIERASSMSDSLFEESLDLGDLADAKISFEEKDTLLFLSLVFYCRGKHYKKEFVIPKTQAVPLSV